MGSWWDNAMSNGGGMMPSVNQVQQMVPPSFGFEAPQIINDFAMPAGIHGFDPMTTMGGLKGGGSWFDSFLTNKDSMGNTTMGWGNALLDLGKAGMQGYLGLQQLDMAKENLAFQKDSFSKQFENQRTLANAEMTDRQNARVASNPNAYASTDEYMKRHGV